MRGRFVLIAVTGLGLVDHVATPLGERVPGAEIHAQVLDRLPAGCTCRPTGAAWIEAFCSL
jgi:CHASE2 domain-containing sensor protein